MLRIFKLWQGWNLSQHLYAEASKINQGFNERFKDVKSKQMELNIFAISFNMEPADVPHVEQLEIIRLQSNNELNSRNNNIFETTYLKSENGPW